MNTSEVIKKLCAERNISLAALAQSIGQSRQNLYQKLKRGSLSSDELRQISSVLGISFEQSFVLPDGERIPLNIKK